MFDGEGEIPALLDSRLANNEIGNSRLAHLELCSRMGAPSAWMVKEYPISRSSSLNRCVFATPMSPYSRPRRLQHVDGTLARYDAHLARSDWRALNHVLILNCISPHRGACEWPGSKLSEGGKQSQGGHI